VLERDKRILSSKQNPKAKPSSRLPKVKKTPNSQQSRFCGKKKEERKSAFPLRIMSKTDRLFLSFFPSLLYLLLIETSPKECNLNPSPSLTNSIKRSPNSLPFTINSVCMPTCQNASILEKFAASQIFKKENHLPFEVKE
jgi:hypothetical protein